MSSELFVGVGDHRGSRARHERVHGVDEQPFDGNFGSLSSRSSSVPNAVGMGRIRHRCGAAGRGGGDHWIAPNDSGHGRSNFRSRSALCHDGSR